MQLPPYVLVLVITILAGVTTSAQSPTSAITVPVKEAYDSWKLAGKSLEGAITSAATISAPEGFEITLVKSATSDEGSWVGMAFDDQGRLYMAIEEKGILRMTLNEEREEIVRTELIDSELEECRGLLWAYDSLYVNANDSKGFYRLRDTTGDGKFDSKALLLKTEGGVGHGRNHLRLGPDGMIYLVHGNDVQVDQPAPNSPVRYYGEDQLILNPWDDSWNKLRAPAGHILRTDKDGTHFEMIASGLRNPLDMDFDRFGQPFVYDADSEWDAGLAWYKPTRVLHIVSGGDYGWRRGTGKWPEWYEDSLPAAVDVGLGSPTGVGFGYQSNFPKKWREAFFIADWSYGRIVAVHLKPDGGSYSGEMETFLQGRPLNITDFVFDDEGAMWFITGGRRTQSALYRVRWTGDSSDSLVLEKKPDLHRLREELEVLHRTQPDDGWQTALQYIDHDDRWIRFAARVALENQPVEKWRAAALKSKDLTALMALVRVSEPSDDLRNEVIGILAEEDELDLLALRLWQLVFIRMGMPSESQRSTAIEALDSHFPAETLEQNHELMELLVYLRAPQVIERALKLAESSQDSRDWSQYVVFLRYIDADQWTLDGRKRYFKLLRGFDQFPGGRWWLRTGQDARKEAVAALSEAEKTALGDLVEAVFPTTESIDSGPVKFVQAWTMDDFDRQLAQFDSALHDKEAGSAAFAKAGCVACHRSKGRAVVASAVVGPDLTAIGNRFDPQAILESIIHPSRVIGDKYRNPAAPNLSSMPPGMINGLEKSEVLALLAYLVGE